MRSGTSESFDAAARQDCVELQDLSSFRQNLVDAFHRLGFKDTWMAQDICLTVEEKLRSSGEASLPRKELDCLALSLLNASGFQDVAKEYASSLGRDPFCQERRNLKPWNDESVASLLNKSLPLTTQQIEQLSAKCRDILRACGLELAADNFIMELSLHLLLNSSDGLSKAEYLSKPRESAVRCDIISTEEYSEAAQQLLQLDICRIMPYSSVFPRARVQLDLGKAASHFAEGWFSPLAMGQVMNRITPAILEIIEKCHDEIEGRYPHLSGTPLTLILCGIGKNEMQETALPLLQNCLLQKITFPYITLCK